MAELVDEYWDAHRHFRDKTSSVLGPALLRVPQYLTKFHLTESFKFAYVSSVEYSRSNKRTGESRLQQLGRPRMGLLVYVNPGLPKTLLNSFPYAEWAALIRLSTSFSVDAFDVSTLPRYGKFSTFSRSSLLIGVF